ncbi:type II toxin-antitoxin system antitoxin SocA domain-containing protein [Pseudobacteroides cellulosolvens]|uniref:Antitoxin SocA-like Panacea domain-containing protein n=1 Tax=Pseudobacteroides cellulosolvens ATCC 35603 = DSM 2933 TaxID=398512 RepID=A0A0L6JX35_9FIRM|nr:type II toxin-antitoxin system antitoxin SocA domain-containing protein [Pseudobacteroides cellulosolvens]KNY30160.1 protein of unknown function DUF4065 [Pseudobacteroides cellulosolvens ATCC 35603 = DSM 2933]
MMEGLKRMKEYCYECDNDVDITITEKEIFTEIKGIKFSYMGEIAYCECCGNEVYISSISDENIEKANQKYREITGIIQTQEIQELLEKYDIGQKPLSKLLGWGETTIVRYIQGLMPTKEYSNRLKELFNPLKMKELLDNNNNALTKIAFKKTSDKVQGYISKTGDKKPIITANYFLNKMDVDAGESITPLKIQKLVYYAQAWLLGIFGRPLFCEDFQAWLHGPVIPDMYIHYKTLGYKSNDSLPKPSSVDCCFNEEEIMTLEMVWNVYGKYDGKYLEKLTHSEVPWQIAWRKREEENKGTEIITKESIEEYYKELKNKTNFDFGSIENLEKLYCSLA